MTDASALAALLNNPHILDNLREGPPYPYTEQDARAYITAMLQADQEQVYAFAITVDGQVVGSIGAFRQENIHCHSAEMGYYLAEPYWRQGLGSSAVAQMCRYLFQQTDIIRIFAEPFADNAASCRILEKNGFVFEGVLRSHAVKNGRVIDMKLYSLLKDEYDRS